MRYSFAQYGVIFFAFILSLTALIAPALLNGYPLLNIDTATYLYAGKEGFLPADRPYFYCLFIRHISLNYSLWFVVIAQAAILYGITFLFVSKSLKVGGRSSHLYVAVILTLLSGISGLAVFCSYITPDIFSGIGFLALALILLFDLNKWENVFVWVVFLLALSTHLSNVIAYCFVVFGWAIYKFWSNKELRKRTALKASVILICCLFFIPCMNFLLFQRFVLSESGNVFVTAKLAQDGILQKYLAEHCPDAPAELCEAGAGLPESSDYFLWAAQSPLYLKCPPPDTNIENEPMYVCLRYKNEVYGRLLKKIVGNKETAILVLKTSLRDWFRQFFYYKCDDQIRPRFKQNFATEVYGHIKFIFPNEVPALTHSTQFNTSLRLDALNTLYAISIFVGFAACIFLIIRIPSQRLCFFLSLLYLVSNAAVCGILSAVTDRYQARIWWLLPLFSLVFTFDFLRKRRSKKQLQTPS